MGLRQISLFFLRWRYEGLARRPKGKPKRQSRATPSEAKLTIRCESRLRPELLDVMRTSNHSKCRMSQLSALFLLNIQEIVVPLSLQKSCNIKHVMVYDTKLQEISESFRLSRL